MLQKSVQVNRKILATPNVHCTLHIAHTAHLFLHTFCIYNKVYNQSINDYLYNRYAQYSIDYIQDTQIVCCA